MHQKCGMNNKYKWFSDSVTEILTCVNIKTFIFCKFALEFEERDKDKPHYMCRLGSMDSEVGKVAWGYV